MPQTIEELSERFRISGLRFEPGQGALTKAVVTTPVSTGELYLHGAHVTAFQPNGQPPVIWMSSCSKFESGKAIRGGVPICFPWFGSHPSDSKAPSHGLARTHCWDVASAVASDEGEITLELRQRFEPFDVAFQATFGRALRMSLHVEVPQAAASAATFEAALHTYLAVSDVQQVVIEGLERSAYIDKVAGAKRKSATGEPIRFTGECDRVYLDTTGTCVLRDPGLARSIVVSKTNSRATVVWNPWIDKSASMSDFGNDEWPGMACIETANVGPHAVTLQPGERHTMTAQIATSGA